MRCGAMRCGAYAACTLRTTPHATPSHVDVLNRRARSRGLRGAEGRRAHTCTDTRRTDGRTQLLRVPGAHRTALDSIILDGIRRLSTAGTESAPSAARRASAPYMQQPITVTSTTIVVVNGGGGAAPGHDCVRASLSLIGRCAPARRARTAG